jgi:hypothetical protein
MDRIVTDEMVSARDLHGDPPAVGLRGSGCASEVDGERERVLADVM